MRNRAGGLECTTLLRTDVSGVRRHRFADGDVVLTMGAGSIGAAAQELAAALQTSLNSGGAA